MNCYRGGAHGEQYGDLAWVVEQIDKLPILMQGRVEARYSEIFDSLAGETDQRYRVNTWLRKVVKKHGLSIDTSKDLF